MLMVLPLLLLLFQGDMIADLAVKFNRDSQYDALIALERQKAAVTAERLANQQADWEQRQEYMALKQQEEQLELQIKPHRKELEQLAAYWNFNVGKHWPLSLIVWPLVLMISWFMIPSDERKRAYDETLRLGSRYQGIILALIGIGLFWVGALGHSESGRMLSAMGGDDTYRLPAYLALSNVLVYLSALVWLAGIGYAFLGRLGLWRLSLPVAVMAILLGVNYRSYNGSWVTWWDIHSQWGHGYFIGFLAAMIGYYIIQERKAGHTSAGGEFSPDLSLVSLDGAGAWARMKAGINDAARSIWRLRASAVLMAVGAVGLVLFLGGVGVYLSELESNSLLVSVLSGALVRYMWLSAILAAAGLVLGFRQWVENDRRADAAFRIFGVVLAVLGVAFWAISAGGSSPINYFMHISLIPLLFGLMLVYYGPNVMRMMWAPVVFLLLAIPWPERYYLAISAQPQEWAAEAAVKFMSLMHHVGLAADSISRTGTKLIIGPNRWDELQVAAECSGLQILFSFVTLSIIYAYLEPRAVWKRAIIFVSSFPIAIICNFMRVAAMAFFYQKGYREVAEGMTHEMIGFMMLIPAFGMLWVLMRALNGMEWLAEMIAGDEGAKVEPEKASDGHK